MAKTYDERSIKALGFIKGCRARPGMYVGSSNSEAILHLGIEVITNSIDEFLAGRNKLIRISVEDDLITIADEGPGIPTGLITDGDTGQKLPALTAIFTKPHSGGKFDSKAYEASGGLHGVGLTAVNALSSKLIVYTHQKGKWWSQEFRQGIVKTDIIKAKPPKINGKAANPGTVVTFTPDYSCFEKGSRLSISSLKSFLKDSAYINQGIKIYFKAKKDEVLYYEKEGLKAFIQKNIEREELEIDGKIIEVLDPKVKLALCWTNGDENITSYVNSVKTRDGGTHVKGLYDALNDAIKPYRPSRAKFKPEDLRSGMYVALNAIVPQPEFSSQTKDRLTKDAAVKSVYDVVKPALDQFFSKNKSFAKSIVTRADELSKIRETYTASKKAISDMRKASRSRLPSKLGACTSKNPDEIELFLVEGDSAAGPAKRSRDRKFQEVLPLRGKLINAYTAKPEKLMANTEVQDIMTACGFSEGEKSKRRVGKIVILTDPDKDAKHIEVLIASLFKKTMPSMLKEGRIYIIRTPLYNCQYKGQRYFAENQEELIKKVGGKMPAGGIQRVKGLGELKDPVLEAIAFDVKKRNLIRVKDVNDSDYKKYIGVVGKDGEMRKELLEIKGIGINE